MRNKKNGKVVKPDLALFVSEANKQKVEKNVQPFLRPSVD